MDKEYIIATDGAYSPSCNQGGIGVVLARKDDLKVIQTTSCKFVSKNNLPYTDVTNQTMEITAAMIALSSIKKPIKSLTILTDSMYVIGNATLGWKRKKNIELLAKFDKLIEKAQALTENKIEFKWCKGHQKDPSPLDSLNTICDKLANDASQSI